jgi:hypothetical protein
MKATTYQEEISIFNTCIPNIGVPIYIKKPLMALRAKMDTNTVIVGDLNTPLSPIDRSSKQRNFRATSHTRQNKHG